MCAKSGIVYPDYNDTVESVDGIRELLLDQTRDPCVTIGDPSIRVELSRAGVLYRNTRLGDAFVGPRRVWPKFGARTFEHM